MAKSEYCSIIIKICRNCVLLQILLSSSSMSAQMKPISVFPLKERNLRISQNGYAVVLGNDSSGIFYLNYISGDTLMLKNQLGMTIQNFTLVLKGFNIQNGIQHCIVKDQGQILVLNSFDNSIQFYGLKMSEKIEEFVKTYEYKVDLGRKEKLIRIEKDKGNVYLVSYNFKNHYQNFYILHVENKSVELIYSNYNPFVEIFFSDNNVSNYSFYNNKLSVTDFYTGSSFVIDLKNSNVDTVPLPYLLNDINPTISTVKQLTKKYTHSNSWADYDSIMNLVNNYNRIINTFFLNDTTLLITVRFKELNLAPFEMIGVDLTSKKVVFKQQRINTKTAAETVNLSNLPIFLGFEESNYIGDGIIYVCKGIPELSKDDLRGFLNKINQESPSKNGTFIFYKYLPFSL